MSTDEESADEFSDGPEHSLRQLRSGVRIQGNIFDLAAKSDNRLKKFTRKNCGAKSVGMSTPHGGNTTGTTSSAVTASTLPTLATGLVLGINDLAQLLLSMQGSYAPAPRVFHSRDLPKYSGMFYDDCAEFSAKFEACAHVYGWTDAERRKYMELCSTRNALLWYETNKSLATYADLKNSFLATFGKNRVDYDPEGQTERMMAAKDPLSYVFHVLNYITSTNPVASETDKVNRLFDGLPPSLKCAFVRDPPKTVQDFTDRFKDTAREAAYNQKALTYGVLVPIVLQTLNGPMAVTQFPQFGIGYQTPTMFTPPVSPVAPIYQTPVPSYAATTSSQVPYATSQPLAPEMGTSQVIDDLR